MGDAHEQQLRPIRLYNHDQRDKRADGGIGLLLPAHLTGIDNVGNVASISTVVKVDTTPPVLTITTGGSNVYYSGSGTTVYFKSSGSGSFTITATDPETGIATTTFPAAASGWTESPGTNSATYTLNGATTNSSLTGVSAKNNAGSTTSENVTITVDTGPTGGALTVNGVAATSGGSTSSTSSTSFSIGSRTDYTAGGSGLKSSTLTVSRRPSRTTPVGLLALVVRSRPPPRSPAPPSQVESSLTSATCTP